MYLSMALGHIVLVCNLVSAVTHHNYRCLLLGCMLASNHTNVLCKSQVLANAASATSNSNTMSHRTYMAFQQLLLHQCRENKDQVSGECASQIFRRQENAADDFRLDKELYEACQVSLLSTCQCTSDSACIDPFTS